MEMETEAAPAAPVHSAPSEPETQTQESLWDSWCLEIIDILRQRKARPDLMRICGLTQRKHGLTFKETETVLERLVEAGQVVKVDYKGDISYRNGLKWRKSHQGGNVLNGKSTSRRIINAITAIIESDASPTRMGATLPEIEAWIAENCTISDLTTKGLARLDVALKREVDIGRVVKLANGNYVIAKHPAPTGEGAGDTKSPNPPGSAESEEAKRVRKKKTHFYEHDEIKPYAVMKKAKLVKLANAKKSKVVKLHWERKPKLDKSENVQKGSEQAQQANGSEQMRRVVTSPVDRPKSDYSPTIAQPNPSSALGLGTVIEQKCDYCLQYSGLNPSGPPEDLLICEDCNAKAHPSCMNYSQELARRALSSPWQCIDCKTCCICTDADDAAEMLFCDACDKGYHMKCHRPTIINKPSGKWVCSRCVSEGCEPPDDILTDGVSYSAPYSDLNGNHTKAPKMEQKPRVTMEQAMTWAVEDVVNFITEAGFPEHAQKFRDQEIDGQSLLLMKRSDILTGMSLKLGPALKIHKHVAALQMDAMVTSV